MGIKLTQEQFIDKCNNEHSNYYDYSKVKYLTNKDKITIICPEHGEFTQIAGKHANRGDKCPQCAILIRNSKLRRSDFIQEAIKVHNGKYNYEKTKYEAYNKKVIINCPQHGDFEQLAGNHLKGQGCPECGKIQRAKSKKYSTKEFIEKAKHVHKNMYDYCNVEYKNSRTPVNILCKVHGQFTQIPSNHLSGQGCPSCAIPGFKPTLPAILYYLSINKGQAYKIGITNKTVEFRFGLEELSSIEIIKIWKYDIGYDAYNKEQEILREFKDARYNGDPLLKSGNTELFNSDILLLDKRTQDE